MIRWLRRLAGFALLAAAARWAVIHLHATRPLYGQAIDAHGRVVTLRIRPLSPAELAVARANERAAARDLVAE